MNAVTHLEKVITGEVSAVTHLEKVIAGETSAVTYTEKVITGEAPPITHLQKVIAGEASPVTHLEYVWAGGSPTPTEHEYTGVVPYSFNADGEPLLDWYIKGNMQQSGTPTPQNPIQPSECGERTGNLCSNIAYKTNYSINAQGVETTISGFNIYSIFCSSNTTYTISLKSPHGGTTVRIHAYDNGVWVEQTKTGELQDMPFTFTTPNNVDEIRVSISNVANDEIMLNTGSTALPYEPYGYKILISSASTTTNVYSGEVQSTRQIKQLVLTGQETIGEYDSIYNRFSITIPDSLIIAVRLSPVICSHYQAITDGRTIANVPNNAIYSDSGNGRWFIKTTDITTVTDFKTYLAQQYTAGTPVTVWYILAEPEIGIVNEPIRKIGDYADTLSMEQAGVNIPTNNGSTTIDVETTLKPSEVYIKWKGV